MIAADAEPAKFSGWRPACVLPDFGHRVIVNLPIGAWSQVMAWHRDPNARPLLVRDRWGQCISIDRRFVAQVERRDLDACVVLEDRERRDAAQWSDTE